MNPRITNRLQSTAALLFVCAALLSCRTPAPSQPIPSMPTARPTNAPLEPMQPPTFAPLQETGATPPAARPTEPPLPTGALTIADSYPFDLANAVMGYSMTASPGKVWVGTGRGTVLRIDADTGKVTSTIALQAASGPGNFVTQMGFDGST